MATLKVNGMAEYERMLSQLASAASVQAVCGAAIYAGAEVVADAIREEIDTIPKVSAKQKGTESSKLQGITSLQNQGLKDGFGITKMRNDDGYYNVKLGFDGYNAVKTKKYPNGQPNVLIARSVVSGTSFRAKNDFVGRAIRRARKQAEAVMVQAADAELQKHMKG